MALRGCLFAVRGSRLAIRYSHFAIRQKWIVDFLANGEERTAILEVAVLLSRLGVYFLHVNCEKRNTKP